MLRLCREGEDGNLRAKPCAKVCSKKYWTTVLQSICATWLARWSRSCYSGLALGAWILIQVAEHVLTRCSRMGNAEMTLMQVAELDL